MRLTAAAALGFVLLDAGAAYAHHHPRPLDGIRDASTPIPGLETDAYTQGKALLGLNDVPGALAAFRTALAQSPQSVDALNGVAVAYDRLGRADLARAYYEAGMAIDPHSPTLLNNFGYSRYLSGDLATAIAPLRAAAASGEPSVVAAANRTLALIAARPAEVRIAAAADPGPASHIEQTSEGEQRLVLDAPAPPRALAASLGDDASLVAVTKPWTEHDDIALVARAHAQDLADARVVELSTARVVAPVPTAPALDPQPTRPAAMPSLPAALAALAPPATDAIALSRFRSAPREMNSDRLTVRASSRADVALLRPEIVADRARPRPVAARRPEASGALAFESDDPDLNAFADRMRRGEPNSASRSDDLQFFAERVRSA